MANIFDIANAITLVRQSNPNIHVEHCGEDDDIDAAYAQAVKDHPCQEVRIVQYVSADYVQTQREQNDD